MKREKESKKTLQDECKKRKIGFMATWSKIALIKRLEEEDIREETLVKTKKELAKAKKQVKVEVEKGEAKILQAKKETIEVEKQLDSFEGARKPNDIRAMLESQRVMAQTEYDDLHEEINKVTEQKIEIGARYMKAKVRLEHIDEAIATISRVL